ncbi:MAG TPA: hypothetical protein DIT99_03710, partial [Candidatus Latescibacteria bacterium]|nr:hypothetical protein [Candidatus Latescibacterota bacterium]
LNGKPDVPRWCPAIEEIEQDQTTFVHDHWSVSRKEYPPCLSNELGDGTGQEQVQPLIRGCKYRRLGDSVLQNRGCLPEDRWLQIVGDSKTRLHLLIGTGVCRKADDCDGNSHGRAIDERTRADCRPGNAEWPDGHCTSPWIGRWSFDGRLASSSDCLS